MRDEALDALAQVDTTHWYYRARFDAIHEVLATGVRRSDTERSILDVGCGPGGTTRELARFGRVTALDPSAAAQEWLARRVPAARFARGSIADLDVLLGPSEFDVVTCFGVLNHRSVTAPTEALDSLCRRVAAGGLLLLEEPADERLRRQMDTVGETSRRFELEDLSGSVAASGLRVIQARYINSWAWGLARTLALVEGLRPRPPDEMPREMTGGGVDRLCYGLTVRERRRVARGHAPRRGTGVWIVAERPGREPSVT